MRERYNHVCIESLQQMNITPCSNSYTKWKDSLPSGSLSSQHVSRQNKRQQNSHGCFSFFPSNCINTMSQAISKREKKRVQDRNAQRAARKRTKDRLALLELQVSQLQGGADKALSDELRQMRKERDELRTLADHLITIAEAMKLKLNSNDDEAAQAGTEEGHTEPDPGLISRIFLDYEDLKTVDSTPFSPLCDTHIIVHGVLNGWDDPVSENEEPIQRLLAHLHRRFMLLRPLARPIDQLALLYLVQMAFLVGGHHKLAYALLTRV